MACIVRVNILVFVLLMRLIFPGRVFPMASQSSNLQRRNEFLGENKKSIGSVICWASAKLTADSRRRLSPYTRNNAYEYICLFRTSPAIAKEWTLFACPVPSSVRANMTIKLSHSNFIVMNFIFSMWDTCHALQSIQNTIVAWHQSTLQTTNYTSLTHTFGLIVLS